MNQRSRGKAFWISGDPANHLQFADRAGHLVEQFATVALHCRAFAITQRDVDPCRQRGQILAAESAIFGEPEPKFGSGIVVLLLPWLTNPKLAREMLLFGNDRVTAERALVGGLINAIHPTARLLDAARAMGLKASLLDANAVRLTKQAINRTYAAMGAETALRQTLDLDLEIETTDTEESRSFKRILSQNGVKAAIAWREARFAPKAPTP